MLALLGAEVIHLESPTRPDGARLVGGVPQTEDQYWERGPIFAALNTEQEEPDHRPRRPSGARSAAPGFVATCDVVVENYTPRVLDQLGLDYDSLRADRPDLVMVRMPGFGLDGPWRDLPAFAFVIEDASGLTWLTGHPDRPRSSRTASATRTPGCTRCSACCSRSSTATGPARACLVEAAMVDAALNVTAEQVIEHSAYGALLERAGNRGPGRRAAEPVPGGRRRRRRRATTLGRDRGRRPTSSGSRCAARSASPTWAADPALGDRGRAAAASTTGSTQHLGEWCRARSGRRDRRAACGRRACRSARSCSRTTSPTLAQLQSPRVLRGGRPPGHRARRATARCRCGSRAVPSASTTATPRCSASTTRSCWAGSA